MNETIFEEIATNPREGDEVVLVAGLVTYRVVRVLTGSWHGVRADRNFDRVTNTQDISIDAWRDIVTYAAVTARRPERWPF